MIDSACNSPEHEIAIVARRAHEDAQRANTRAGRVRERHGERRLDGDEVLIVSRLSAGEAGDGDDRGAAIHAGPGPTTTT